MLTALSVIYPVDAETAGDIVDDVRTWPLKSKKGDLTMSSQDLHEIMVKPLPPGCRLTCIFDVRCFEMYALTTPLTRELA
jgi:hypothetical protein